MPGSTEGGECRLKAGFVGAKVEAPSFWGCPARLGRRCFATEINPHTIQVSIAAPYPGTFLHRQAVEQGWLDARATELIDDQGIQIAPLHYPHLSHTEIFHSVEEFYRRFYFRSSKIAAIVSEMVRSPQMLQRRLREGLEFFHFLREHRNVTH
jgi:hypothetical protein